MYFKRTLACCLLSVSTAINFATGSDWVLLDDFQRFYDGQIFTEATEIGWHATNPTGVTTYRMLTDPEDLENIALFVKYGLYGVGFNTPVLMQKALPNGGIAPGETGTLFFRSYWEGFGSAWLAGTADQELEFDDLTGFQIVPGAWGDFNAQIRIGLENTLDHRDGDAYVSTNPPQIVESGGWYSFWLVVENTWDMGTTPVTSTGVYTLYAQGPGIGDGVNPALIPVGTDPPKNKASLRRDPVDASGNPQSIIWAQFATSSGMASSMEALLFLVDDFYYSSGENLTHPLLGDLPGQLAIPTSLKAILLPESGIQLSWQDNSSAETGYRIQVKIGDGRTWQELADISEANAISFRVEGLDTNQPLRFRIQAYADGLESGYSNTTAATWGNPVLQGAVFQYSIWWNLDWFGQYAELDQDWIYHDELELLYVQGENANSIYMYSALLESWLWTSGDLFPWFYKYGPYSGWYYYYTGSTKGNQWFARYSDGTYVRAPYINEAVPQPAAPSNLVANSIFKNKVYLHWEDNADYEVGYRIYMMAGEDGEWTEVATLPVKNLTYYHLEGIDTSVPLQFRIQAYKYGSESDYSNIAPAEANSTGPESWWLIDNFQAFNAEDIFYDATEIGWYACAPEQTDEYWMLQDPLDPDNIAMYVESGNYGVGWGNTWVMKALPGGGIQPGQTGTIFFRSRWSGFNNSWSMATADKPLAYDNETGLQTAPGAWGDMNALIRINTYNQVLEHRDGKGFVSTNPPQVFMDDVWYSFWMVVDNSWDMSASPPTCTGTHTLFVQGEGIGDGVSPTLIPVGSDPPKDRAFLRRPPIDDEGNPRAIIWAVFATDSGAPRKPIASDVFLLDDFYFSEGVNLTKP